MINIGAADMKVPNTTLLTHVGKYTENSKNSGVNINKRIIHPDNIIKMNLGGLISKKLYTLSKSNLIHLWNTESQVSKTVKINAEPNIPNLTLIPREDDLLSSLTVNSYIPRVLSTSNKSVLLWDVEDSEVKSEEKGFFNDSVKYSFLGVKSILSTKLESDIVITKFLPNDKSGSTILGATKGGDLKLWDIRTSYEPMNSLSVIHSSLPELTAIDIEPVNSSLIAVGFSDGIIDVFDLRLFGCNNEEKVNLPQKIQLSGDNHRINDLRWSPSSSGYLASSGEDVVIWNTSVEREGGIDVLFRHCGHKGEILSFDWCHSSKWTLGSASNETIKKDKEDVKQLNIQLWRISELITNEFDENTLNDWDKL